MMQFDMKNPVRRADGAVDVEWNHPDFGWISFTCMNPDDPQWENEPEYVRHIWNGLMQGDFGPIAPAEGD